MDLVSILTLTAQLAIALLSISIAAFAIAASFFGRDTSKVIWAVRSRKEQLEHLVEIAKKSQREVYKRMLEIESSQVADQERKMTNLFKWLHWRGSVISPLMFFVGSIVMSALGISFYNEISVRVISVLAFGAILYVCGGLCCIFKTLQAIQYFGFKFPKPSLRFSFRTKSPITRTHSMRVLTNQQIELTFEVYNIGDEVAEDLKIFIFFPPDFEVVPEQTREKRYITAKQGIQHDYPHYTAVVFRQPLIHVNEYIFFKCVIKTPKKEESYPIPVRTYERNIGYSSHEVVLRVTEKPSDSA